MYKTVQGCLCKTQSTASTINTVTDFRLWMQPSTEPPSFEGALTAMEASKAFKLQDYHTTSWAQQDTSWTQQDQVLHAQKVCVERAGCSATMQVPPLGVIICAKQRPKGDRLGYNQGSCIGVPTQRVVSPHATSGVSAVGTHHGPTQNIGLTGDASDAAIVVSAQQPAAGPSCPAGSRPPAAQSGRK